MLLTFRQEGSRTRRLPLELRFLARDHVQEPVSRPNGIQLHQWQLCVRGSGALRLGDRRYALTPGMGFFLLAGEPHDYRGETGDYTVDAFGFGGEAAGAVLKALRFQASGVYRFSDPDSFRRQVGAMAELPGEADPARRGSVMVYQLLLQLSRSIRSVPGPGSLGTRPRSGFIREMISYMEEHCEQPLSLDDMSDRFSRSKEYICAAFKKETGMTCVDFLTRVRVFRARGLLLDHPEMKLEQVAKACGFSSASYFGAVFKKDTGVTPGAFRLTAGY